MALLAVLAIASLIAAAGCGRDLFGPDAGTTPSLTGTPTSTPSSTGSPTPTPTISDTVVYRFPTPTATAPIGFGLGYDGQQSISANTQVNVCAPVEWASNSTITLSTAPPSGWFKNDGHDRAYVLWQVESVTSSGVGAANPISDLNGSGLWEIVRVHSVAVDTATLAAPMVYKYRTLGDGRAQACFVPEYSGLNVNTGARIMAPQWDGGTGGLAAVFVSGTLNLASGNVAFDATGVGYQGGTPGAYSTAGGVTFTVVDSLVETTGGSKGESMDVRSLGHHGTGRFTNAGGGGNDDCGGGGGGGLGGAGGPGGLGFANAAGNGGDGGGFLGVGSSDLPPVRLLMGGGGGGGATHHMNTAVGRGGSGGGAVLVFAATVQNAGILDASGGLGVANGTDGAGGGGAGGTVILYTSNTGAWNGTMQAKGGLGGLGGNKCGSGGGGAGGRIALVGKMGAGHCIVMHANGGNGAGSHNGGNGTDGAKTATVGTCPN